MFFVNGPQALYSSLGCLEFISGIDPSPANKDLLKALKQPSQKFWPKILTPYVLLPSFPVPF